jgi:hypothetical protein
MALIIGSTAMNHLFNNEVREPKDYDYFAKPTQNVPAWITGQASDVFWHDSWNGTRLDLSGINMATLDELYTIKVSHAYWELNNGSWDKHMADILFLKNKGAKLDMDLHKLLYPVWVETHGAKKMNLAQAAGNFFADAVVRIYDHDSIHDSVAFGERPLYEAILKDGQSVDIDPDKLWVGMDFDTQVKLFREEIAATALERWMIPRNYRFSPGLAYKLALKKTITSLTKGKSARFIVTNFEHFMKPHDYMAIHRSKMDKLLPLDDSKKGMV